MASFKTNKSNWIQVYWNNHTCMTMMNLKLPHWQTEKLYSYSFSGNCCHWNWRKIKFCLPIWSLNTTSMANPLEQLCRPRLVFNGWSRPYNSDWPEYDHAVSRVSLARFHFLLVWLRQPCCVYNSNLWLVTCFSNQESIINLVVLKNKILQCICKLFAHAHYQFLYLLHKQLNNPIITQYNQYYCVCQKSETRFLK